MGWVDRLCLLQDRLLSPVWVQRWQTFLVWTSWFKAKPGTSFPRLVYVYYLSLLHTLSINQLLAAGSKSQRPNHSIQEPLCLYLIDIFSYISLICLTSHTSIMTNYIFFPLEEAIYISPPHLYLCCVHWLECSPCILAFSTGYFYPSFWTQLQCNLLWNLSCVHSED